MHDIRAIRDDPDAFDRGLALRGVAPQSEHLLYLDAERRRLLTLIETQESDRKKRDKALLITINAKASELQFSSKEEKQRYVSQQIGDFSRAPGREMAAAFARMKDNLDKICTSLRNLNSSLPNLPAPGVPEGADESGNVEQARWGTIPTFDFAPRDHADLGPALGLDFEAGARIAGTRFTLLKGGAARLHRALGQFMLDRHAADGWAEVNPPLLVRDEAVFGTGQLPKFADDLFRTTDGRWLIPTAEVSLTNSVAGQILDDTALPLRLTALTPCFRSEAGAAGRDTRGLIRQHQFEKVELVAIATADRAEAEHERMTRAAEGVLEALGLPYRRMLLCAGDMGFTARRTYDLEVWMPGQGNYREISSCSWCGDFQARRMDARHRPAGAKGTQFVHTLNGSGVAVGRALVAVIENGQQADGSVIVPTVLRPYMGGVERIGGA